MVNSEKFYRPYFPNANKNTRDCWTKGQLYSKSEQRCNHFPMYLINYRMYDKIIPAEIEPICKQMWLVYDKNLKFCVRRNSESMLMSTTGLRYEIFRPERKYIANASAWRVELAGKQSHINCLQSGLDFDYKEYGCKFLKIEPTETAKLDAIRKLLQTNQTHLKIWQQLCSHTLLLYDPILKMCTSKDKEDKNKFFAVPDMIFSGKTNEIYDKHLACILKGYKIDSDKVMCTSHYPSKTLKVYYQLFEHIFIHAKDVMCYWMGMLYHRQLDICIQTEILRVKIKKRQTDFCQDTRCQRRGKLSLHGPDLRRIISKKEQACFELGQSYQRGYDMCEDFPEDMSFRQNFAYRIKYLPYLHLMLRKHCYDNSLDYSTRLRICISKESEGPKYRQIHHEMMKRKNPKIYRTERMRQCLYRGLDYDDVKEKCLTFPIKLTEQDIAAYEEYREQHRIIACGLSFKKYNRAKKTCMQDTNFPNDHKSNDDKVYMQKIIIDACKKISVPYDPILGLCRAKVSDRELSPEQLLTTHCMKNSLHYDSYLDACISKDVTKGNDFIEQLRKTQIRALCDLGQNLEYNVNLEFCVMKRRPSEYKMLSVPILTNGNEGLHYRTCLKLGML